MAPRRSLAEELAELATPRPAAEADFEGDELENEVVLDDEEIDYAEISAQHSARKAQEKRDKLRADIQMQEPSYSGRRTSRAAAFGEPASSSSSDAPSNDGESDDSSHEEEDMSLTNEEQKEESQASEEEDQEASSSSQDAESSGEEDGSNEADKPSPSGQPHAKAGEEEDDEEAELAQQYAEAAAQDQIALANMRDRVSKDQAKGLAVLHQKRLWEQNLELRILLQKCLQAANRMPYGASHFAVVHSDPTLAASYTTLASDTATTIDHLLDLQQALVSQHPAAQQSAQAFLTTDSSVSNKNDKKDSAQTLVSSNGDAASQNGKRQRREDDESEEGGQAARKWQRIDEEYRKLVPFRDASIDRWHRKTMLISGAGAVKGSLRALNQSVSSQVATLMKDPLKLARRTGVAAQQRPRVLCQATDPMAEPAAELDQALDQPKGSTAEGLGADGFGADLDLQAFDDNEFYAQLLKEFLDSNSTGSHQAAGAFPQGKKKRKNVDRRASKGRKLRYHVQEKLVNFMAPVEQAGHGIATQLFSSLFGSK